MSVDQLYNIAVKLKKNNDLEFAADAFRKALIVDKDHVPSLIGLGTLLREHPELVVGSEDAVVLLTKVTRHVCCPPEIKKATIAITAVHRMMKAAKQTADQKSKPGQEGRTAPKGSISKNSPGQDVIG
eukprot:CAMPEP_0172152204 /NCGR_PEP_ID=MMETSP1050-20130122/700_1 /TAXON_ID=233186 /ORGANISM="Cryptomonas curvata, Strain CCAP979/52" /LENGTH=127 /DNA_ID=CAMNT_0012820485 /DNA_START=12 /DNA_END=395 /DNA_ORIENTATION=+